MTQNLVAAPEPPGEQVKKIYFRVLSQSKPSQLLSLEVEIKDLHLKQASQVILMLLKPEQYWLVYLSSLILHLARALAVHAVQMQEQVQPPDLRGVHASEIAQGFPGTMLSDMQYLI